MDYVKIKPGKPGILRRLLIYLLVFLLGAVTTVMLQRMPAKKTLPKRHIAKHDPKLRFYDVLVNNKDIQAINLPYLLEVGVYKEQAKCKKLAHKFSKYKAEIRYFTSTGTDNCQVILGPFASINDAYAVKLENKDYNLSLRNNYQGVK